RRPEAEDEPARPRRLLHDTRVHRRLDGMTRRRSDDPPADREALRLAGHERSHAGRRPRLHPVLSPPRVRLGEPDRVHPGLVHRARRREHLVERLHRELHDADPKRLHAQFSVEVVGPSGSASYASGETGLTPSSAPCVAGSPPRAIASWAWPPSAVRTCCTCWFTIGWSTRCPIEPTGPRILTSALHAMAVPPSAASESVNDVSMFIIAPTPLPLTASFANSGSRS